MVIAGGMTDSFLRASLVAHKEYRLSALNNPRQRLKLKNGGEMEKKWRCRLLRL